MYSDFYKLKLTFYYHFFFSVSTLVATFTQNSKPSTRWMHFSVDSSRASDVLHPRLISISMFGLIFQYKRINFTVRSYQPVCSGSIVH